MLSSKFMWEAEQQKACEEESVCTQLKFKEQSSVYIICLDLSKLVEKSQVTECERSKFLSSMHRMEADAGSYQDSGFASINVSLSSLCSSDLCKHNHFTLAACNIPIWFISTTYCFIYDVFPACQTKRAKLKKSLSWIIKSLSLRRKTPPS